MRSSGILLPVFSLPGKYGIGCFSREAYDFIDFLSKAKQKYWQILPLGPTSFGDSPYQSFSTFAGNPYFVDLEALRGEGLLTDSDLRHAEVTGEDAKSINYAAIYETRFEILRKAYCAWSPEDEYYKFERKNHDWLEDYALFMAIKDMYGGASFDIWDDDIRNRSEDAVCKYRNELADDIRFYKFIQYKFSEQWSKIKKYANDLDIKIIGDIPIYVAFDSADLWANPKLFQLDDDGIPSDVAGCPPDGFSPLGQLWGNPLYKWEYHKETEYSWWKKRFERCSELYDVVRIDHFRGFDEYYAIPFGSENAVNGEWRKGPGSDMFDELKSSIKMDVIAEDLGFITDSVRDMVRHTGFPNMKVLEFAFDSREPGGGDYTPYNYNRNCVVYTGTHDNETLYGWLMESSDYRIENIKNYLDIEGNVSRGILARGIIREAYNSVADMCILPLQDHLLLDNSARINVPSTLGGNWQWRLSGDELKDEVADRIAKLTMVYGRSR